MSISRRNRKKLVSKTVKKQVKPNNKQKTKEKTTSKHFYPNGISNNENNKEERKNSAHNHRITVHRTTFPCRRYEEFHDHFLTYDQIVSFLKKTQKGTPKIIDLVTIGNSSQGRPIYIVIIKTDSGSSTTPKLATLIEAGLNGEDAFAVSNALYMIDYLSKNPSYVKIMDYFILPCGNPDAYDQFVKEKINNKSLCGCKENNSNSNNKHTTKPRISTTKNKKHDLRDPLSFPGTSGLIESSDHLSQYTETANGTKNQCLKKSENVAPKRKENQNGTKDTRNSNTRDAGQKDRSFRVDLSLNFPVILGLNDMRNIPTSSFLEKINLWKENYIITSPEMQALVKAITVCQFATKLLISLQEGGEAICYPYGFCEGASQDTNDLREIAKKGKCAISRRQFQFGSIYNIRGLTYGTLIDFLKAEGKPIKYTYLIQVHRKASNYDEKRELNHLMTYGCEIMECVKRMSTAVFKFYTNITGNTKVEVSSSKPGLDRRSNF